MIARLPPCDYPSNYRGPGSDTTPITIEATLAAKCRTVNSPENDQQPFLCWRPANAPILPGSAQAFHIDRRMLLRRQATAVRQSVVKSDTSNQTSISPLRHPGPCLATALVTILFGRRHSCPGTSAYCDHIFRWVRFRLRPEGNCWPSHQWHLASYSPGGIERNSSTAAGCFFPSSKQRSGHRRRNNTLAAALSSSMTRPLEV